MTIDFLLTKLRYYINNILSSEWRIKEFANFDYTSDYAIKQNLYVRNLIENEKPFFIGRFGTVELEYYLRGQNLINKKGNIFQALFGAPICWPIQENRSSLSFQAGVFPYNNQTLFEFCRIYEQAVSELDALISWVKDEKYLYTLGGLKNNIDKVNFGVFELPFRFHAPWTIALEGKKVLVISPFADLIEKQFKYNRENLFPQNIFFLPEFDLKTIKAVNIIANIQNIQHGWRLLSK